MSEAKRKGTLLPARPKTIADERRNVVGETPLDSRASHEGRAIVVSSGYRPARPKGMRQRSRGHGLNRVIDYGAKLPNKKIDLDLKPKPKVVPVPDFMVLAMRERVQCQPLVQSAGAITHSNNTP